MVFYTILTVHEYFWPLKEKKWGKMGQNKCARNVPNHVWLILMKSVPNEKEVFPQMIKVCQKNFSCFKRKKMIFGHFCDFRRNHKNRQKSIFSLERWKFFSSHPKHLGKQYFLIFYNFWFDKKSKKTLFFTFFLAKNCPSFNFEGQKVLKIKVFMESLQNRDCHIQPN